MKSHIYNRSSSVIWSWDVYAYILSVPEHLLILKMFFDQYERYLAMIDAEEEYRVKAELAYAMHVEYATSCGLFCSRKNRIEKAKKFLDLYYEYMHCC